MFRVREKKRLENREESEIMKQRHHHPFLLLTCFGTVVEEESFASAFNDQIKKHTERKFK
jgi:hypothetical protein